MQLTLPAIPAISAIFRRIASITQLKRAAAITIFATAHAVFDLRLAFSERLWTIAGRLELTSILSLQTGEPILLYDDSNDLTGTGEGPGNGSNDRWNIVGNPNNLRWSQNAPIPYFSDTYDSNGNVTARSPICTAVANTPALLEALDYAGGCYSPEWRHHLPECVLYLRQHGTKHPAWTRLCELGRFHQ